MDKISPLSQSLLDIHWFVSLPLFLFLKAFATSGQKSEKHIEKNIPSEVHEWLAHVYSVRSHGHHPGVHVYS